MKTGKLFGIGVGPGDPGLLTVKAVETIKNADIIITPKTEKKDGSVAYNIARKYIPGIVSMEYLSESLNSLKIYMYVLLSIGSPSVRNTKFLGIASYINQPLTEWEENVLIIPATASPEKFDAALSAADNAVIMKVYKNFAYVQEELRKHHMMKRSVMVSRAGLPDEIIQRDLDSLPADYKPNYLSTIIAKRDED